MTQPDKLTKALEELCPGVTRRNTLRRVCVKCMEPWIKCRCDSFIPFDMTTKEDL
jgi:hypothetical protein